MNLFRSLLVLFAGFAPTGPRPATAHDIHLSHTRMVVDGSTVLARVRVFHDDLEIVLRRQGNRPDLRITDGSSHDSAFAAYFDSKVSLKSAGERLHSRVLQSGPDSDASDSPMWWYLVELKASKPIQSLAVRYALMFEQFSDQRNIIAILKTPGDKRRSLYFAAGEDREQVVTF
jgi:hypothetical protein